MPTVAQPLKSQLTQSDYNALIVDDRSARGIGSSAKELLECLSNSAQEYYSLSESLLKYLPTFTSHALSTMDTNLFERFTRRYLGDTLTEIYQLLTWEAGWNSYNSPKPQYNAVARAAQLCIDFYREVADLGWIKPNVTGGPEGGVVFEWWHGQRKLTIYVEESYAEYVQVWGTDIDAKITDGDIESISIYRSLWLWLIG